MSKPANSHRGEIAITLSGRTYVMRPSFEAIERIDSECGSILQLAQKGVRMSASDIALVVCEGIRAHGRHVGDTIVQSYDRRRVGRLIMAEGLATEAVMVPVGQFLAAALTGGAVDEGNADATGQVS
jgi:hypothetical protein